MAIRRNGIPSPSEKIESKKPPSSIVFEEEASKRMDPSSGPTHGVQPKARLTPSNIELSTLPGLSANGNFIPLVIFKNLGFERSNKTIPNTTIIKPDILFNNNLYSPNVLPTNPAIIPKNTKIIENPKTKASAFLNIINLPRFTSKSFLVVPVRKAKKLGTSGKVHGIKKLIRPAIKAGSIRAVSIIKQIVRIL